MSTGDAPADITRSRGGHGEDPFTGAEHGVFQHGAVQQSVDGHSVEVVVGRVAKAHGLHGDVLVDVRTDEPDRRFAQASVFSGRWGTLTLRSARWHGPRLLVRFEEVADRETAEAFRGAELIVQVPPDERPDDPEEYYDHQLVGLTVVNAEGHEVGEVVSVLHLPFQDVLTIRAVAGQEVLVPFVGALVPDVDLRHGRLTLSAAGSDAAAGAASDAGPDVVPDVAATARAANAAPEPGVADGRPG